MIRRIVGVLLLVVGVVGLALAGAGVAMSGRAIDAIGSSMDTTLTLLSDTLTTVRGTFELTKTTVDQANTGLLTASETSATVAQTVADSQPLIDQMTEVATGTVPDSLDAVEAAIPNLAAAAGAIDSALQTLGAFQFERTVLGQSFGFDLGLDYNPEVPLSETVLSLGASLDGLADELRGMEANLVLANSNLGLLSANVDTIATNLETVYGSVGQLAPLVDAYVIQIDQTQEMVTSSRGAMNAQLATVKAVAIVLILWFGLYQLVPLYLGWKMIRSDRVIPGEVVIVTPQNPPTVVSSTEELEVETAGS
jgi:hypothetical protein